MVLLMNNPSFVQTVNSYTICDAQAKTFALLIHSDIKTYIEEHKDEFHKWQAESGGDVA